MVRREIYAWMNGDINGWVNEWIGKDGWLIWVDEWMCDNIDG